MPVGYDNNVLGIEELRTCPVCQRSVNMDVKVCKRVYDKRVTKIESKEVGKSSLPSSLREWEKFCLPVWDAFYRLYTCGSGGRMNWRRCRC